MPKDWIEEYKSYYDTNNISINVSLFDSAFMHINSLTKSINKKSQKSINHIKNNIETIKKLNAP